MSSTPFFSTRQAALACAGLTGTLILGGCSLLHGHPRTQAAARSAASPAAVQNDAPAAPQTATQAATASAAADASEAASTPAADASTQPSATAQGTADTSALADSDTGAPGATTTVIADAGAALKPTAPKDYVVKRGDTLWGIANLFLRNPWQWPEIWYVNPQIHNPHRIYPGDMLQLALGSDGHTMLQLVRGTAGREELVAAHLDETRLEPQLRSSPLDTPIDTIPYSLIAAFISKPSVLTREQVASAAYVVALAENHDIAGEGHELFVRKTNGQVGTRYSVMHVAEELTDPDNGHKLGYVAIYTGTAQITRTGQLAEAVLTSSARETLQGDVLIPEENVPTTDFAPHIPSRPVTGSVIDVVDNVLLAGQDEVVAINRGTDDGVDRGAVLTVDSLPVTAVDECSEIENSSTCAIHHSVVLPTDPAGTILVFRSFDHMSYGLILADTVPVQVGEAVHSP